MNLLVLPNQFDSNYLYFLERKPNLIIEEAIFSKLLYSTKEFITTGLFIFIPFEISTIKHTGISTIEFNTKINESIIQKIIEIEKQIMNSYFLQYQIKSKTPIYDISNKFQSGSLKIYSNNMHNKNYTTKRSVNYYIKISGIWETANQIGLTYKIIEYPLK